MKTKPIERVLVAVNYSEPSFHAAWIALAIARSMNASMTLIHIHVQERKIREAVAIAQVEIAALTDEKFHELLIKLVGDPAYQDLQAAVDHSTVEFDQVTMSLSEEICAYAKSHHNDLIVIGSQGRSNIKELFMGSVSHEIVRKAHCPVTVVH